MNPFISETQSDSMTHYGMQEAKSPQFCSFCDGVKGFLSFLPSEVRQQITDRSYSNQLKCEQCKFLEMSKCTTYLIKTGGYIFNGDEIDICTFVDDMKQKALISIYNSNDWNYLKQDHTLTWVDRTAIPNNDSLLIIINFGNQNNPLYLKKDGKYVVFEIQVLKEHSEKSFSEEDIIFDFLKKIKYIFDENTERKKRKAREQRKLKRQEDVANEKECLKKEREREIEREWHL